MLKVRHSSEYQHPTGVREIAGWASGTQRRVPDAPLFAPGFFQLQATQEDVGRGGGDRTRHHTQDYHVFITYALFWGIQPSA